jgi:hypothetical protein
MMKYLYLFKTFFIISLICNMFNCAKDELKISTPSIRAIAPTEGPVIIPALAEDVDNKEVEWDWSLSNEAANDLKAIVKKSALVIFTPDIQDCEIKKYEVKLTGEIKNKKSSKMIEIVIMDPVCKINANTLNSPAQIRQTLIKENFLYVSTSSDIIGKPGEGLFKIPLDNIKEITNIKNDLEVTTKIKDKNNNIGTLMNIGNDILFATEQGIQKIDDNNDDWLEIPIPDKMNINLQFFIDEASSEIITINNKIESTASTSVTIANEIIYNKLNSDRTGIESSWEIINKKAMPLEKNAHKCKNIVKAGGVWWFFCDNATDLPYVTRDLSQQIKTLPKNFFKEFVNLKNSYNVIEIDNTLWFGTKQGVVMMKGLSDDFKQADEIKKFSFENANVKSLIHINDYIYFGGSGIIGRINLKKELIPSNVEIYLQGDDNSPIAIPSKNIINSLSYDKERNRLWCTTNQELLGIALDFLDQ